MDWVINSGFYVRYVLLKDLKEFLKVKGWYNNIFVYTDLLFYGRF